MTERQETPEALAQQRAKYLADVLWHGGAFLIVNAFLWILDISQGGGLNWAGIVTVAWGFGLAFHVLAYLIDGRQLERRKTQQYLDEDRLHGSQLR